MEEVMALEQTWILHRPEDFKVRWKKFALEYFKVGEYKNPPYWLNFWPSNYFLIEWLFHHKEDIAGELCIDLGCGLGFTALIGQWLGAKVIGVEYVFEALTYAKYNAASNNISQPYWINMDWDKPAIVKNSIPYIWCSDIIYDTNDAEPIICFFDNILKEDGIIWISEPKRPAYEVVLNKLEKRGWNCKCMFESKIPYSRPLPKFKQIYICMWEISRG